MANPRQKLKNKNRCSNRTRKCRLESAKNVYQQKAVLDLLQKASKDPKLCNKIINLSPNGLNALSDVAHNSLIGSFPLKKRQQKELERHKKSFLQLAQPSRQKRKAILQQKGGTMFPILATLLPLAIQTVSSLVGKRV